VSQLVQKKQRLAAGPVICLVLVLYHFWSSQAQGALKIINPVSGGKIVYGQVDDQTTEAGAMGSLLRSLHTDYGERPQVGKLFQIRNSQSVAAFFSIAKHNQGEGQLAGMIIAIKVTTDHVEAALVSDEASRFPSSLNSLMTTLFGVWHPFEAARPAAAGFGSPDTSLKQFVLPDRSASVSLPNGWQVRPRMSGGGTIYAGGPNGEMAALGMAIQVWDPRNARVAQILRREQQGGQSSTQDAQALFYPYGDDPATTYTNLVQMKRLKSGMAPASFQISSSTSLPERTPRRGVHLTGQVDYQDGTGPRELNVIYIDTPPVAKGCWWFEAYVITAPVAVAEKERATLAAILHSFRANQTVINQEGAKLAQPEIDRIHAIGDAAKAQADAAHERNDIQNSSVYQHWDDMDRRSQSFSNYQLGYSVIQDNSVNGHGTFWNEDADALVANDPQRYEYVTAPNYWKGVDY
jgi:hypothetical protein